MQNHSYTVTNRINNKHKV